MQATRLIGWSPDSFNSFILLIAMAATTASDQKLLLQSDQIYASKRPMLGMVLKVNIFWHQSRASHEDGGYDV